MAVDEWRLDAACKGRGVLFDRAIDEGPGREVAEAKALRICLHECDVARKCLVAALRSGYQFAIRGGTTARQRRRLLKARPDRHEAPAVG